MIRENEKNRTLAWALKPLGVTACIVLIGFVTVSFCRPIDLTTADLGRHIKNGETFFKEGKIIDTNYYSYTDADRPLINHHWASGVVMYVLWNQLGFHGLSIVHIFVSVSAFCLFFFAAWRNSNFYFAFFISLLSIPLISTRVEIRPEAWSYLFFALDFLLLMEVRKSNLNPKFLFWIPLIQILWVNMHIFFVFGALLSVMALMDSWVNKESLKNLKWYFGVTVLTILACLCNPSGLQGALSPLTIFQDYGYMLAENQSVFFMLKRYPGTAYLWGYLILLALCVSFWIILCKRKLSKPYFFEGLVLSVVAFIGIFAIRGIALFGFVMIPIVSILAFECAAPWRKWINNILLVVSSVLLILGFSWGNGLTKGIGLKGSVNDSAEFFKRLNIQGPVFNNYDIGGYLIYHLFPKERVFVDNRPEAYSTDFFKKTYIKMQEDESVWEKKDQEMDFNVIYFQRKDMTPWAQPFLIRRLEDKKWAPVFVDDSTLILLKRNLKNKKIVEQYELPKETFISVKT